MEGVITLAIFLISAIYVLILDLLAFSPQALLRGLVLPTVIFLGVIYYLSKRPEKMYLSSLEKWPTLFLGSFLIQFLLVASGGVDSPFYVLIYLSIVAISFLLSFETALSFSFVIVLLLISHIAIHHDINTYFAANIRGSILQFIALLTCLPIAYLISYKYHFKDIFFNTLKAKSATDDAIMRNLEELIIITNRELQIISVNDTVERTLFKSRSELLYKNIFDVILLKDSDGKLVTKQTFFSDNDNLAEPNITNAIYTLCQSSATERAIRVQIQKTKELSNEMYQISFIFSYVKNPYVFSIEGLLEKARVRYEAMNENVKLQLTEKKLLEIRTQIMLLEKIEEDIYNINIMKLTPEQLSTSRIDLTKLAKQIVLIEKDFADSFHVSTKFELLNFSEKDIAPLVVKDFPIILEDWTGPFFTISTDVKRFEIVIKKLFDLCIFLSSSQENKNVAVTINRSENNTILMKMICHGPVVTQNDFSDLFKPYYGVLYDRSNLHFGSGLEGYLVKTISDLLSIPIRIDVEQIHGSSSKVSFSLVINKFMNMSGA